MSFDLTQMLMSLTALLSKGGGDASAPAAASDKAALFEGLVTPAAAASLPNVAPDSARATQQASSGLPTINLSSSAAAASQGIVPPAVSAPAPATSNPATPDLAALVSDASAQSLSAQSLSPVATEAPADSVAVDVTEPVALRPVTPQFAQSQPASPGANPIPAEAPAMKPSKFDLTTTKMSVNTAAQAAPGPAGPESLVQLAPRPVAADLPAMTAPVQATRLPASTISRPALRAHSVSDDVSVAADAPAPLVVALAAEPTSSVATLSTTTTPLAAPESIVAP